ncbi:MAG: T9SS type A sorting domain-containing protein [Chitinophagaceae bacterium]
MKKFNLLQFLLWQFFICTNILSYSQINYTANDAGRVPVYNQPFLYGTNMGYYGPSWDNITKANIATGNPSLNIQGAGAHTFRVPLPEDFLEYWGYTAELGGFNHYTTLGVKDNTIFLGFPSAAHRDNNSYSGCGQQSWLFANMYLPIWDGGADGTPVNDNNYYALYVYKTVMLYRNYTKFWEILNEPDFDGSGNGWKDPGQPGNWWDNNPPPCALTNMKAPIFHYNRLLRISYEVIKSIDSTAYITVGGLGFPAFLDAILRNTDNPTDGTVSTEYPLKGGAYFDVLSFHNYPMYSLSYWDNNIYDFAYKRHSDAAVEEFIKVKNRMATVLTTHGYNNSTYPEKHFICTENNIPRQEFGNYIGSDQAQTNYVMKALVTSQQNNIKQYYLFALAESKTPAEATQGYEMMGLFQKLEGVGPLTNGGIYGHQFNSAGIGFKSTSEILRNFQYDNSKTQLMNLSPTMGGGAFRDAIGNYVYVLWAKTSIDRTESASETYSFPTAINTTPLVYKKEWNFSITGATVSIPSTNIPLTGTPIFLSENFQLVSIHDREKNAENEEKKFDLRFYPNPANNYSAVKFTLTSPAKVRISILDGQGKQVKTLAIPSSLPSGTHQILIPGIETLASGIYYGKFETEKVQFMKKLVIAH